MSGFGNIPDLKDAMPKDVDAAEPTVTKKTTRTKRGSAASAPASAPSNPLMNDKRYADACAEMSAFGGKGLIIRGFDAGAIALEDESFKLDAKEERQWDNFFYVLSKKPLFDVGSPWFLALFFIVTLLSQLGWRVFERSEIPILVELFPNRKTQEEREEAKRRTAGFP